MPLGQISDHVIKIEFQMRGTPHAHCLLWVKDAPKIDNSSDDAVCEFIDKYITAVTPQDSWECSHTNALVTRLQKHAHSDYCWRKHTCQFGFAKPPSLKTMIAHPPAENDDDSISSAKQILEAVQMTLANVDCNNTSIQELCTQIGISTDTYMAALSLSTKGPNVILKRNPCDIFINPSDSEIVQLWGGNVYLQYIINEIAAVMYVCSYMAKGEKAVGETGCKRVPK